MSQAPSEAAHVDAYIAAAAPFARPILMRLRGLVNAAHPDIAEAIKWRMPMFVYRGKIVANMAAFTAHASFGTWQREGPRADVEGMGQFGRLTSLADLPPDDDIIALVREAVAKVDDGGSLHAVRAPRPVPPTPGDLVAALAADPVAAAKFAAFPPGCRRDYIGWIEEAKTAPTRAKRIATTVEWSGIGKRRS